MNKWVTILVLAALAVGPAVFAADEQAAPKETPPCCAKEKAAEAARSGCCGKEAADVAKSGCPMSGDKAVCPVTGKTTAGKAVKEPAKAAAKDAAAKPAKNNDQAAK